LFGGIVKLLYVFVVAWLLYKLYRTFKGPTRAASDKRPTPDEGGRLQGGELVQDPHCGLYIPKQTAIEGPGGRYFCSEACRNAYVAEAD
jgi:hypothetical protein